MGSSVSKSLPAAELLPASKSYLVVKANQFIEQKQDYDWFMASKGGTHGKDDFQRRVVLTTFPSNVTQAAFEDYVEKKFSDQEEKMKNNIKALFHANLDSDTDKRITFDYGTDGQISAVLTQILFERHPESGEIKVSVG
ncbi:unnamed protein product, partial [Adineta ricciae]